MKAVKVILIMLGLITFYVGTMALGAVAGVYVSKVTRVENR